MPEDREHESLRKMEEALAHYAHAMHEYTLQLWTECRRAAEETLGKGAGTDHKKGTSQTKNQEKKEKAFRESSRERQKV